MRHCRIRCSGIRKRAQFMMKGTMSPASNQQRNKALPSAADFLKLSRRHSLVPVYRTITADLETPVSAFLRIASEEPEAFLLESVEGGKHVGRYTFIGIQRVFPLRPI